MAAVGWRRGFCPLWLMGCRAVICSGHPGASSPLSISMLTDTGSPRLGLRGHHPEDVRGRPPPTPQGPSGLSRGHTGRWNHSLDNKQVKIQGPGLPCLPSPGWPATCSWTGHPGPKLRAPWGLLPTAPATWWMNCLGWGTSSLAGL